MMETLKSNFAVRNVSCFFVGLIIISYFCRREAGLFTLVGKSNINYDWIFKSGGYVYW